MRHEHTIRPAEMLSAVIAEGRVSHAYLISGENRQSLQSDLEECAAALLCEGDLHDSGQPVRPCGRCRHCLKVRRKSHPDLIMFDPEKRIIRVDDVRVMRATISFSPFEAERRVYLIPECERMNRDAANALLKTLEEPPDKIHILLSTTSVSSLLPTIVSRCQHIRAGVVMERDRVSDRCPEDSVSELILELVSWDEDEAERLYHLGFPELRGRLIRFIAEGAPLSRLFSLAENIASDIILLKTSVSFFETVVRDLFLLHAGGSARFLTNRDIEKEMRAIASCYGFYIIEDYLDDLRRISVLADRNINRRMLAERMLVFWTRNSNGRDK